MQGKLLQASPEQVYNAVKIKVPVVPPAGNYPLAGKALCFALHVNGLQLVTAEEIAWP